MLLRTPSAQTPWHHSWRRLQPPSCPRKRQAPLSLRLKPAAAGAKVVVAVEAADEDHTGFADNLKCNICLNVAERPVTVR